MTTSKKKTPAKKNASDITPEPIFPIIGIGASAGGLEAFELFFKTIPADSGMAFMLVPHLDPGHASMLSEILQRNTTMPVHEALDQALIQANHVYIIPPNKDMAIFHGTIHLSVPEQARGLRLPIDSFFRSLAEDQGERAICVILSGSGSDGTLGLRAVHGAGGVSFVQEPATAKYDGMPTSAVKSGLATYVLPVEKITEQLVTYVKTIATTGVPPTLPVPAVTSAMTRILMLLRSRTGNDFSQYKKSTITRRIERRMVVHSLKDMDAYARYLRENPAEVQVLFRELLINVTSFFRDTEAFAALKREVLTRMFDDKPENYIFRVWVPGCASGEEAYSLAILFREYMDEINLDFKFQIYATDIDDDAIATARAGMYPENISIDVSSGRLRRFFAKEESGYRIKKDIREMVVFAIQNVITDPPFTKMDLISCRNLLIYLEAGPQNHIIPAFHYALRPGGVLFLSPSEGIGNFTDLYAPVDKKWKIYTTKPSSVSARALVAQRFAWTGDRPERERGEVPVTIHKTNFAELTKRVLLQSYAPPSVITDEKGNIVYVHGDTGKYLQPAPGLISTNVIDMAREGLQLDLRTAIMTAALQKKPVVAKDLPVRTNGGIHGVDLAVRPLADTEATGELLLISFQDAGPHPQEESTRAKRPAAKGATKRVEGLEQELAFTKENLQATIEEMQAANEELKSTNEELQSTNEELQSTNEELETSKEEMQSVNEEIVTVNSELQAKIEQLTDIQNDMKNLLENVNIGTIFLDDRLAIKRFTREAVKVYRLAPSDMGRPLADIRSTIPDEDLVADAQGVLDTLIPLEKPVRTTGNEWYNVRIMPYRTYENAIDGVVLTFSDVTALKTVEEALLKNTVELQASNEKLTAVDTELRQKIDQLDKTELALRKSSNYNRTLLDASLDPLVMIDEVGSITDVNPSTEEATGYSREELIGTDFLHYFTEPAKAKEGYQQVFTEGTIRDYPLNLRHRDGHFTPVLFNAAVYRDETGKVIGIFAAARDISERKNTEELLFKINEEVRLARDYAQNIIDTIREPLLVLNGKFEVVSASQAFYATFHVTPEATQGKVLYELGNNQWDIPGLHELLETVLPKKTSFENFEVGHNFPVIGQKKMLLNARRIFSQAGSTQLILLAIEDITAPGTPGTTRKPGGKG